MKRPFHPLIIGGENNSINRFGNRNYLRVLAEGETLGMNADNVSFARFNFVKAEIAERTCARRANFPLIVGQPTEKTKPKLLQEARERK